MTDVTDFQVDACLQRRVFLGIPIRWCEGIQTGALFVDAGLCETPRNNADAVRCEPFVEAGQPMLVSLRGPSTQWFDGVAPP